MLPLPVVSPWGGAVGVLDKAGHAAPLHVLAQQAPLLRGRLVVAATEVVYELVAGSTWLLPAGVGEHVLDAKTEGMSVMRVRTRP